jgi:hypothetical protein
MIASDDLYQKVVSSSAQYPIQFMYDNRNFDMQNAAPWISSISLNCQRTFHYSPYYDTLRCNKFAGNFEGTLTQPSDQRIKTNIVNIDKSSNLEIFRKIRPLKYGYINQLEYCNVNKYGFIAQEIKELLPEAVIKTHNIIPSIYCNANVVNLQNKFLLYFEKPLQNITQFRDGIKLKCYDYKNEILWVTIKEIINTEQMEIEEQLTHDKIFIYGHNVDDFLQIETDAIWTVSTAALQEVDRQQQDDKVRIAELEMKLANQQSLINEIIERLNKGGYKL